VQPLRPAVTGHTAVQRYQTKPGEQVQVDWGEFVYEHEGKTHKFYGLTAILGYSRMRFVTFVKRCETPTLIRCLMEAFEYFGGLTRVALTDGMKSVLLEMEENKPRWNARFADAHGFHWSCGTRLQAVHAPNKRQSRAHRQSCQEAFMGRGHLHGSG
jgi:transposase